MPLRIRRHQVKRVSLFHELDATMKILIWNLGAAGLNEGGRPSMARADLDDCKR
jgi:hypothetical protein